SRIERDGGGVCPRLVADHIHAGPRRPRLELLDRRGAEGVRRNEEDLAALALEAGRELADGRGLAGSVRAEDQDHRRRWGGRARRGAPQATRRGAGGYPTGWGSLAACGSTNRMETI